MNSDFGSQRGSLTNNDIALIVFRIEVLEHLVMCLWDRKDSEGADHLLRNILYDQQRYHSKMHPDRIMEILQEMEDHETQSKTSGG